MEAVAEKDSITTALHKNLNKLPQMELWMVACDKVVEYFGDSWNSHFSELGFKESFRIIKTQN